MNPDTHDRKDHNFLIGLLAGTFVGAGLAIWLAPRAASEVRQRMTDSARALTSRASERFRQGSTRVDGAVDDFRKKGEGVRDDMADAVVRGAQGVERLATAVKTAGR